MPTHSNSSLSTYETCPLRYRYRYIDRIRMEDRPEFIEAFMGSRVHETMERLYKDLMHARENSLEELLAYYGELWEKNWHGNVKVPHAHYGPEDYRKVGEKCIADYYGRHRPFNQSRTLAIERMLVIRLDEGGHYTMRGAIDRLAALPGGLHEIHDYKTSQFLPPQAEKDADRQLALYQIGIQQSWPDIKEVELVWHYMVFDREIRSRRKPEHLEQVKKEAIGIIEEIEKAREKEHFPPEKNELCKWCDYQPICPLWKHMYKTEKMPKNEYLKEPGVELVNKYAELEEQRKEFELKYNEERDKLREAIIAYSKREKVENLFGSGHRLLVRLDKHYKFPESGGKGRKELEELLKKEGRWEEVSQLSAWALDKAVKEGRWDGKLTQMVKQYAKLEERAFMRLSEWEEE